MSMSLSSRSQGLCRAVDSSLDALSMPKSKSGQVAVSVFRQRIRSPLLRMARRGLALVSKQTRGRQAGRQAGRQEAIAEGAEEAHVRAGDRGVGDRE